MKKLLTALAIATATVAPSAAQAQNVQGQIRVVIGDQPHYGERYYDYNRQEYRYHNRNPYQNNYLYRGYTFVDRYGYYRCQRPNGRIGYLINRYGQPITRYNIHQRYYGYNRGWVRCR